MANRDYDDRNWDRGQGYGRDDRGWNRQQSQFDDRSQDYRGPDYRGSDSRAQDPRGSDYGRDAYGRDSWSRDAGRARTWDDRGAGEAWSGQGSGAVYGSGYGQRGDARSYDRRYGSEAGRSSYGDAGRDDYLPRGGYGSGYGSDRSSRASWSSDDRDQGYSGRYDEDRFGRSRGSMGGGIDRDYADYRTGRDRSLLGDIASALGFGSDRDRRFGNDDRLAAERRDGGWGPQGRSGQGWSDETRSGQGWSQGSGRGFGPRGYTRSDARIEEDVNERLSHGALDASDVEVSVKDGEVTLSGKVRSRADKRRAEDVADDVSGVKHVQNNLRADDAWSSGPSSGGSWGSDDAGRQSQARSGSASGGSSGQMSGQSGGATSVSTGQAGAPSNGPSGSSSSKTEPSRF